MLLTSAVFTSAPASAEVPAEEAAPSAVAADTRQDDVRPPLTGTNEQILPWDGSAVDRLKHPNVKAIKATTHVAEDGSWQVDFTPVDATGKPSEEVSTASFSASVCAGRFFDPTKVSGRLEWGGEQTCSGTYAPQYLRMRLQSTCTSWYCAIFVDETSYLRSSESQDYTRVSRVFRSYGCDTSTFRKYRIDLFAYVRGARFGPFISNQRVQAYDVSA